MAPQVPVIFISTTNISIIFWSSIQTCQAVYLTKLKTSHFYKIKNCTLLSKYCSSFVNYDLKNLIAYI